MIITRTDSAYETITSPAPGPAAPIRCSSQVHVRGIASVFLRLAVRPLSVLPSISTGQGVGGRTGFEDFPFGFQTSRAAHFILCGARTGARAPRSLARGQRARGKSMGKKQRHGTR